MSVWIMWSVSVVVAVLAVIVSSDARISERSPSVGCSRDGIVSLPSQSYYSLIQSWGDDSIRVRVSPDPIIDVPYQALISRPPNKTTLCHSHPSVTTMMNGNLQLAIADDGTLTATRLSDSVVLMQTTDYSFTKFSPKNVYPQAYTLYTTTINYTHAHGYVYGLGEHQYQPDRNELPYTHFVHNFADSEVYSDSRGGDVMIPYYSSSAGFSLLINNAGWGYVDITSDKAYWESSAVHQIDIWISTIPAKVTDPTYWGILSKNWAEVTGYYNPMPYWVTGFVQSKDRYRSEEEILDVAHNYYNRSISISMIVIDYMHYARFGDWDFLPNCWPTPANMVKELTSMNMRTMVSVWPVVDPLSNNFAAMNASGYFSHGPDNRTIPQGIGFYVYDAFNPAARNYLWDQLVKGYFQYGVQLFWLDESEPDFSTPGTQYWFGGKSDYEVNNLWSVQHAKGIYDNSRLSGMQSDDILILSRSTWIGNQLNNVLLWSGDTFNTFDALYHQILIGQNVGMSGVIWWTTDAGGYTGGNLNDPVFQELLVRWFQFAAFSPVFRNHGHRYPEEAPSACGAPTSGPNEVYTFNYASQIEQVLALRENLRGYVFDLGLEASKTGRPMIRPMFYDFADEACYSAQDQYMFGKDWLVAPVYVYQAANRSVYLPMLPTGQVWRHYYFNQVFAGGQRYVIPVSINDFPLFKRSEETAAYSVHGTERL